MRYFKVLKGNDEVDNQDDIVCRATFPQGPVHYDLLLGRPVGKWDESLTFHFDPKEGDKPTDFLGNNLGWILVSDQVKSVWNRLGVTGVAYLPVNIVNRDTGDRLEGYSVANLFDVADALNLNHSDHTFFELDDEKILNVKKFALTEQAIGGRHIFKLKGYEIPWFVSEEVKRLIDSENLTGCGFLEVKVV